MARNDKNQLTKFAANLPVAQKGILIVAIPLICELIFVGTLSLLQINAEKIAAKESFRKEVFYKSGKISECIWSMAGAITFLHLTNLDLFRERFYERKKELRKLTAGLAKLLEHDEELHEKALLFDTEVSKNSEMLEKLFKGLADERDNDSEFSSMSKLELRTVLRNLYSSMFKSMNHIQDAVLRDVGTNPEMEKKARDTVKICVAIGVIMNVFISLALAIYFTRDIAQRIKVLVANSERLANREKLLTPVGGKDEIAILDQSFHHMATVLEDVNQKERAMIDNAVDVIFIADSNLEFVKVGSASREIFGIAPEDLVGGGLCSYIVEEDAPKVRDFFGEMLKAKQRTTSMECRILKPDYEPLWISLSACWSQSDSYYFCVAHDISERKRLEVVKQEFSNMLSHDLRTPLTSLSTFLELLGSGKYGQLSEKGLSSIATMDRSLGRLVQMVSDLLDLEKITSGAFTLNYSLQPLVSLVEVSTALVEGNAVARKIEIDDKVDPALMVNCDPELIGRVIQNLLSNAIKYSPEGGIIELSAESLPDKKIKFLVRDHGPGVPSQFKTSIFKRFSQIQDPNWKRSNSSGLGLTICKSIVEQHGGSIGVDSTEGDGATFWFLLPS